MADLIRFGVSLDSELLAQFDTYVVKKGYPTRSKAIQDIIHNQLVIQEWEEGKEVVGAIILVYDHHKRELATKILEMQHDFGSLVISTQHIHLNHHDCLELIAVKGQSDKVRTLAEALSGTKGIKHVSLNVCATPISDTENHQ